MNNSYCLLPLTQDLMTVIDKSDYKKVSKYTWHANHYKNGQIYVCTTLPRHVKPRTLLLHRLLVGKKGLDVDHRNRDGLDNSRKNLRACTTSQNAANSTPKGRSKYKGVCFDKSSHSNCWMAVACKNYKNISIGRFATEKEAALAYNKKAKELHGKFAKLNKVR